MAALQFKLRRKFDGSLATAGIVLSLFGLVMILSASQVTAAEAYGSPYYFFGRQLIAWVVGMFVFFYFLRVPLEKLYQQRGTYLLVTVILLAITLVFGTTVAGARRWFSLGFFNLQAAEFAKLFLVIYFAGWLAAKGEAITSLTKSFLPFLLVLFGVSGLIILEPDMGTMLVVVTVLLVMFFVAKASWWQFLGVIAVGLVLTVLLIYAAPYRAQRLEAFLGKGSSSQTANDPQGAQYHNLQALIAIGSGGWWGEGFGQGISKYSYLPEAQTDSIFAVIAEELGFIRATLVILVYGYITWRGYVISQKANSRFVQLLATGLTTAIIVQALINIGGLLNIIPLTGVPLPFVSYGGSSLVVCMGMLGLLTNTSREVS